MVGKTHMAVGAAAGIGVCACTGGTLSILAIAAAILGALVPDIDHHNSKISTANVFMKAVSWVVRKIVLPAEAFILNTLSHLIGKTGLPFSQATSGHRGPLTHSIVGVMLLSLFFLPILFLDSNVFFFIVIGMLSHVAVDMLNPEGAPVAYPISSKKISILPHAIAIKTGTKREEIVKIAAIAACGIFMALYCGVTLF